MQRFFSWPARVLAILIVAIMTMGAADNATRYNDLGHKMMCACGCGQVLIECNHFGCPDSDRMLGELRVAISKGGSDDSILAAFQDKYGPTILAAPLLTKFNLIAWIVPPAVLILGIAGTIALIRRWRQRAAVLQAAALQAAAGATPQPHLTAMRERIRRETEQ
jgi:cytochrome c-type biogenesis protein CcmH/NrfF